MAFATKYNLTYQDHFGTQWDIDFQQDGFSGDITDLIGTGDPTFINYEAGDHFTHSPLKASHLEVNLYELTDDAYLDFFLTDKAFKVKVYKGVDLYWQGWTMAEGYRSLYNLAPKGVTLIAIDGIGFLKSVPLSVSETGTGAIDETGIFSVNKFFKQAFDKIGFGCNIYESFNLYDYRVNQALSPFTETHLDTWCFYKKEYESLYDVLTKILKSWGARLYQKDGCWYMDHIKQLSAGTITYRVYNSSLTYTGTSVEDRTYDITSATGSPLLVPINHSLYKELERPYSKFVLSSDYRLNKNLIRYTDEDHLIIDGVEIILRDERLFIKDLGFTPVLQGVRIYLGNVDFNELDDQLFTFGIKGSLVGEFKVKLYIENAADATTYYYNNESIDEGFPPAKTWDNVIVNDLLRLSYTEYEQQQEEFDETISVYKNDKDFKGPMYLLINSPHLSSAGRYHNIGRLNIELDSLYLNYLECTKEDYELSLENSANQTNEGSYEISIYSDPQGLKKTRAFAGDTTLYESYVNPHLVYPGLFYYYDGSEYQQCLNFKYGTDEQVSLERFLVNDIMTFYSTLRFKISGTLLGQIDFGNILDYDDRRYMIVSFYYNLKKSQTEVVCLELTTTGSFLQLEDGSGYVLTEDGNKIPI